MNAHPELAGFLNWLLVHSLQADVLVLLVLLAQWLFRRRLTSHWRFALWWIVLARLLLPFNPQSALSVFNFIQPALQIHGRPQAGAPMPANLGRDGVAQTPELPALESFDSQNVILAPGVGSAAEVPGDGHGTPAAAKPGHWWTRKGLLAPGLAGLWLAGVLALAGGIAAQTVLFHRRLARACAPADPEQQRLLDQCLREFGVNRPVELIETGLVRSPALFGLRRLRLLLPCGLSGQFGGRELRYIFLHEIAHVKRGDLWLNWLVTGLQVLHWFNPLLWIGFARLRADRELACDELALLRAGDTAGAAYGETVVKLLEKLSRPAAIPGLVGILEDKKQMRRRVLMILNFRRPGRWSALAALLLLALGAAALTDAQTGKPDGSAPQIKVEGSVNAAAGLAAKPAAAPSSDDTYTAANTVAGNVNSPSRLDLTGVVTAKGGGVLPAPATVFIVTAAPKSGASTDGPSGYPDCAKNTQTDARGGFKLVSLDPGLTFQLLAVAKGYVPQYASKVDPAKGAPVAIELDPVQSADAAPNCSLRGRVVDPKGQPIAGAVVDMVGIESQDGASFGALEGVDPLAVSDGDGEFLITAARPFEMMDVKVTARTFADKPFRELPSGKTNELQMTEGASLTGRVLLNGKPLAGVLVGVSAVDRAAGYYLGQFKVGTDERGRFAFVHLPPDGDFQLYTLMSSMKNSGTTPVQKIHTGKAGETTDAGDLIAMPAHRLAGRVALADGSPAPAKTRLVVTRDRVFDSTQVTLDKDGSFDVPGVPDETITLSARVKGYRVSGQNASLDTQSPSRLVGRVDCDITNLVFLLEKGAETKPDFSHVDPDYWQLREHPLRGAEGSADHSREWLVSGRVVDAATEQPLDAFVVTPGQADNLGFMGWNRAHAFNGASGFYLAYVNKRAPDPMILVEADGYLPQAIGVQPGNTTNMDFALTRGSGPAGTVLQRDGLPAPGAKVVLLTAALNQAGINSSGELTTHGNGAQSQVADSAGHFLFKPVWGAKSLAAASSNGFAIVSLDAFRTNPAIVLEPLGTIAGFLKRTSGPGTNETLDVMFSDPDAPNINLYRHSDTDDQGRFKIDAVPAGHLRITYRHRMANSNGEWTAEPLQEVDLKPGQNLVVNITAPDRKADEIGNSFVPPPPPNIIPGQKINGVVLLPDGRPAAGADVALQVDGEYLQLGKAVFDTGGNRGQKWLVTTGPDGSFTLPLFEKSRSVIALNEEGYAQVSLGEVEASRQIRLQKWGRIEGTLRVGRHLGTNEVVQLSGGSPHWTKPAARAPGQATSPVMIQPPFYRMGAFDAQTDGHGHFGMTFVPPGSQCLWRRVPLGDQSWTQSQLATVVVKPGETAVVNLGGQGRTVAGNLVFAGGPPPAYTNGMGLISTPALKIYEKLRHLKTDAERQAYYALPEVEAAENGRLTFTVRIAADGSFRAEEVLPGTYEFVVQPPWPFNKGSRVYTEFASTMEFTVPPPKTPDDESVVRVGTIKMEKRTYPLPDSTPE